MNIRGIKGFVPGTPPWNAGTAKKKSPPQLCACGCGKMTNPGKKFILGHISHTRRKIKSLPQLCACGCGEMANPGKIFIYGHNQKNKKLSKDHRNGISKSHTGKKATLETIKKLKESHKGHLSPMQGKHHSRESNLKNSLSQKARLAKNPDLLKERSKHISNLWKSDEYVKKQLKGRSIRPNKPETIILNILNELFPNQWKYTGDFSFMINGKNPDFTNINGQKKLIELFGDYWHKKQDPEDRKKIFKKFGYETLVIWECELKNDFNGVVEKIKCFHNKTVEMETGYEIFI